ncbi:anthranilate phosphoribosyltransferase [Desulfotomaculum sp. 1211_IL3151]|uniref:anthranilate phosphoribosyltransferase n=1 Tax=Desulfotomaculum sp. 1211_IL3151 TaxID=3084055 RepID=UPI002FD8CF79
MLQELFKKVIRKENLTEQEAMAVMETIVSGKATVAQTAGFLVALGSKGETVDELLGFVGAIRSRAIPIDLPGDSIDTCGTGGDGGRTFNISTAVAIVAAAAGIKVAKHGNRAVSSRSGSADVLEVLGINIGLATRQMVHCINEVGIGFLFAPSYHPALRQVAGIRRELGIRTVFNLLGPLVNPAKVTGQVVGVYDRSYTRPVAAVLQQMGVRRALVVHGADGLDEITTTNITFVSEVRGERITDYTIDPRTYGIKYAPSAALAGGDAVENAALIRRVLAGELTPARDIVLLNSAAALWVGNAAGDLGEGIKIAAGLIDSGAASAKLDAFIKKSQELSA